MPAALLAPGAAALLLLHATPPPAHLRLQQRRDTNTLMPPSHSRNTKMQLDKLTLKEQMLAYKKMVEEKGLVLTPDQERALKEIENDDQALKQTGLADFSKNQQENKNKRIQQNQQLIDDDEQPNYQLDPVTGMPIQDQQTRPAYGQEGYGLGDRPTNHRADEFQPQQSPAREPTSAPQRVPQPPPAVSQPSPGIPQPPPVATTTINQQSVPQSKPASIVRKEGDHGTGHRFMPMASMEWERSTVLLPIAGAYPGLSAADVATPMALPQAEPGKWMYHRLLSDSLPGGFVGLPSSELLDEAPNTVAIVCQSSSIGVELLDGNEHEVLALIDRGDEAVSDASLLNPKRFYALSDDSGYVHIRWVETLPAGWSVLGRLLYTQLPNVKRGNAGGGFAELDDSFEF